MKSWIFLFFAILAEVLATSALKASHGFTRLLPTSLVASGYGLSFYLLALSLRHIPVGMAYAIWSGLGTVSIALLAWYIYDQRPDAAAWLGIALIVAGVLIMSLLSKTSA